MFRSLRVPQAQLVTRCTLIRRRTYATPSSSITLEAHQLLDLDIRTLPFQTSLHLTTSRTWPKSESPEKDIDSPVARECAAKLPLLLSALDSAPNIIKTTIPLHDFTALPILKVISSPSDRSSRGIIPKLAHIGLDASCLDIGLWKIPNLPSIEISHSPTRLALSQARSFSDKPTWHGFVAASADPVYKSFDYSADFHSRDLDGPDAHTWVDLGVMGCGYWRMEDNLDIFSLLFAQTLDHNSDYFKEHEWKAGMYEEFWKAGGGVSDMLGSLNEKPTSIRFNVDVSEVPENVRQQLLAVLEVAEDEEVVYEGKVMRKRKKGAE